MACRAALLAVLPSTGSALAVHKASQRDVGLQEDNAGSLDLERMLMPAESDCQVAQAGSDCYKSVEYLRSQGFEAHPTWYPGYTSESSFEEVQDMLHGLEKAKCPKPCAAQFAQVSASRNKAASLAKFDCRDTIEGDLCYISVAWLKEVGFGLHPDWYPGLDKDSSVASIQAELHRNGKSDCSQPCAPTEAAQNKAKAHMEMATQTQQIQDEGCVDATVGSQCYTDVSYGIAEGIRKHPQFYEGLSETSNFKQVQEFLYLNNRSLCERPCPAQKMSLDMMVNHYEDMREKKRVQDMSTDELTRYLNGDWDGYVSKVFRSQDDHSTFEKRKYNPTTSTTPSAEETANDDTHEETSKVTVEPPVPQEAVQKTEEAQRKADAQTKAEAARLAKEAAEAADAVEQPFPEMDETPYTDASRELLVCLLKLKDVTAETFGDIKAECEEKLPLEGDERGALVKESMRFFLWAQRHVQFLKAKQQMSPSLEAEAAKAEAAKGEEAKAEEAKAEEVKAKDQGIVDEPMPEIDPTSVGETEQEMEQRLRKQFMEEMKAQTTTTAVPHKETEEEMRERIKAEVMRELAASKPATN